MSVFFVFSRVEVFRFVLNMNFLWVSFLCFVGVGRFRFTGCLCFRVRDEVRGRWEVSDSVF